VSGNSEAKELMEAVAFLYALLLLIDEVADKAQKDQRGAGQNQGVD
jgi:hypothetical protein